MDYIIVTIPRTGSHYLYELIKQFTGVNILKSHEIQPDKKMISIARDPYNSFVSDSAMHHHYHGNFNFDDFDHYLALGKNLLSDAEIIIDYEDLINKPYQVVEYLSKILDIQIINDKYENNLKDQPKYKHLVTSTISESYNKAKESIKDIDLSEHYEVYNKMLDRCVKIRG
jgi:hypothetical protein